MYKTAQIIITCEENYFFNHIITVNTEFIDSQSWMKSCLIKY